MRLAEDIVVGSLELGPSMGVSSQNTCAIPAIHQQQPLALWFICCFLCLQGRLFYFLGSLQRRQDSLQ